MLERRQVEAPRPYGQGNWPCWAQSSTVPSEGQQCEWSHTVLSRPVRPNMTESPQLMPHGGEESPSWALPKFLTCEMVHNTMVVVWTTKDEVAQVAVDNRNAGWRKRSWLVTLTPGALLQPWRAVGRHLDFCPGLYLGAELVCSSQSVALANRLQRPWAWFSNRWV